jgi:hypothetical protein
MQVVSRMSQPTAFHHPTAASHLAESSLIIEEIAELRWQKASDDAMPDKHLPANPSRRARALPPMGDA